MVLPLPVPTLAIPAGYLTLVELGGTLSRQGVPVRVAADCADDVYALRAPKTNWPRLRAALVADGRLMVSEDGGTWTIALDLTNAAAERRALGEYEESVRARVHDIYQTAAEQAKAMFAIPFPEYTKHAEDREKELASLRRKGDVRGQTILYRASEAVDEADYSRVAIPAALMAVGRRFGQVWTADSTQAAPLLVSQGDLLQNYYLRTSFGRWMQSQDAKDALRSDLRFVGKTVWDPLTLTVGFRWSYWVPRLAGDLSNLYEGPEIWSLAGVSSRDRPTGFAGLPRTSWRLATPGQSPAWGKRQAMPARALSVSEAALRWAQASDEDLVAYVSPMNDLPLAAKPTQNLEEIVESVNAGRFDRLGGAWIILSRIGEDGGRPFLPTFSPSQARRMTPLRTNGFTVLRTETRFLDGLVANRLNVPTAWSNARLKSSAMAFGEIVRHVSSLEPARWTSGFFAVSMLDWCDPVSFYPFAVLLSEDSALREQVEGLAEGERMERSFRDMRRSGGFLRALVAASPFDDDVRALVADPLLVPFALRDAAVPPRVEISRSEKGYSFRLSIAETEGGNDKTIWQASVRLPQ